MTTTIVDLLRHGEMEGNSVYRGVTDDILTDHGWQQMVNALENRKSWDILYTSPLQSCCEFAELIASEDDTNIEISESFQETDFGLWEGLSPDEIMKEDADLLKKWWKYPTKVSPPEGEDFHDFQARVLSSFKQMIADNKGKRILLVTHSGVIRLILMHILSMPEEAFFRINVDYASLTKIHYFHDDEGESVSLIKHG
jgi:alpha-ribazole phosphatase